MAFCGKCGKPLVNGTCECQRPRVRTGSFCGKCGRPLVNGVCLCQAPVNPAAGAAAIGGRSAIGDSITFGTAAATRMAGKKIGMMAAAIVLTLAVAVYFLVLNPSTAVFGKVQTPEDTIQALEDAMNSMNQDDLLACFDSDLNDLYDGSLEILGAFVDMDLGWVNGATNVLGGILSQMGYTPKVTMTVTGKTFADSEHCLVDVLYSATMNGIGSSSEQMQLPMRLVKNRWLISLSDLDKIVGLIA